MANPSLKAFQKMAVLVWVAACVAGVLSRNGLLQPLEAWLYAKATRLGPHWQAGADRMGHWFSWYTFLAGLDQRYTMFAWFHRNQNWEVYKGKLQNQEEVRLPLEGTPERSVWQRLFVDHKAGKMMENMYADTVAYRTYADYLCRTYQRNAAPFLRWIVVEHWTQYFLNRAKKDQYPCSALSLQLGRNSP